MSTSRWTDDILDRARQQGDPMADAAMAEAFELGQVRRVNDLIAEFDENSEPVPQGLPPLLTEYFQHSAALPAWADRERIERGNDLWGRYVGHIGTILHAYSLPAAYACGKGAEVLNRSTRIHQHTSRRIMETAQFLNDVLETGGLGASGRGLRSSQKIRLLHATIRHFLRNRSNWDSSKLGLPINQEDLVGTMHTFGVLIPLGLKKLGVNLPDRDRDDFFHVCCVFGHLLGVDPALMPRDFADGKAQADKILARQTAPSEAGRVLTKALLDHMAATLPILPGAPATLVRHFVGDKTADMLAVPPADWTQLAIHAQTDLSGVVGVAGDTVPLAAKLSSQAGELLIKAAVMGSNRGNRYDWTIPESEAAHQSGA